MRILYMGIGDTPAARALPQSWPDRLFSRQVGRHEVLTFGHAPGLDIQVPPAAPFAAVTDALPAGWVPDLCVCTHVDHLLLPPGIENAPFPTVALTADWDFRVGIAQSIAEAFDLTLALGEQSARAVDHLGAPESGSFAWFGVPEAELEGQLVAIDRPRPIDLLFTGTINDHSHLDRSRWLARLARLSERYRVVIGPCGSSPGAYRELLQQTKAVFTFHRRGELQLRFTDAIVQGAAVLDNGCETARLFEPGVEFVAYEEGDLEQQVDRLLAEPERRVAMVEAARRRVVREFGSIRRFELLFDQLEGWVAARAPKPRPAGARSPGELARRIAEHCFTSHFDTCLASSPDYLAQAEAYAQRADEGPRKHNDLALIRHASDTSQVAMTSAAAGQSSAVMLEALLNRHPDYAPAHYNLGWICAAGREYEPAARAFLRAKELLLSGPGSWDPRALLHRRETEEYRGFVRSYNDALYARAYGGGDATLRRLVAAECAHGIALVRWSQGRIFEAREAAVEAVELAPHRGQFTKFAARIHDLLGDAAEALRLHEHSVELLPFHPDCRTASMRALARAGELESCSARVRETVALCRAQPAWEHLVKGLSSLMQSVRHLHEDTPGLRDLVRDEFSLAAVQELSEHLGRHPDERVERRIEDLLRVLGKAEAADDWARHVGPGGDDQPTGMVPARTPSRKDPMRPTTSSAVRT